MALRTWAIVSSGFFPPMLQAELRQEQMAHAGQDQVSLDGDVLANFEVVHAKFRLAVLEHPLDPPAAERL